MKVKNYISRCIAARKKEILEKERDFIDVAIKASRIDNCFILKDYAVLQKETEEALKEAGYQKSSEKNCVKYFKVNNYSVRFVSCINNIILTRIDPILNENISEDDDDCNNSVVYRYQKEHIEKAISETVAKLEDYQFRFQTLRIEFDLSMPKLRLNKVLEKELEEAGFVRESSDIGISSCYTGKFKTCF